ncbi:hypothetical protein E2I00_007696, partial [Balaenoptera physalus]
VGSSNVLYGGGHPFSHSKFVVVSSTVSTSRLDANASQIMKIIRMTAVNEMNEPIDEIGVQRIKIGVDIRLGLLLPQGRKVSNIVIPAASTGKENRSNTAVISTDHMNNGV